MFFCKFVQWQENKQEQLKSYRNGKNDRNPAWKEPYVRERGEATHQRKGWACGVTNEEVAKFENNLSTLEQQSAEVDKIRAELSEKVKHMNATFMTVKEDL